MPTALRVFAFVLVCASITGFVPEGSLIPTRPATHSTDTTTIALNSSVKLKKRVLAGLQAEMFVQFKQSTNARFAASWARHTSKTRGTLLGRTVKHYTVVRNTPSSLSRLFVLAAYDDCEWEPAALQGAGGQVGVRKVRLTNCEDVIEEAYEIIDAYEVDGASYGAESYFFTLEGSHNGNPISWSGSYDSKIRSDWFDDGIYDVDEFLDPLSLYEQYGGDDLDEDWPVDEDSEWVSEECDDQQRMFWGIPCDETDRIMNRIHATAVKSAAVPFATAWATCMANETGHGGKPAKQVAGKCAAVAAAQAAVSIVRAEAHMWAQWYWQCYFPM